MTDDLIDQALRKLRKAAPVKNDTRGRFAAEFYLERVLRLYRKLQRRDEDFNSFFQSLHDRHLFRRRTHELRQLLDLTCDASRKVKSRWYRALRYAWVERRMWDDFHRFMRKNGGVSGCAAKLAIIRQNPWGAYR
jgi:hypothetical protein